MTGHRQRRLTTWQIFGRVLRRCLAEEDHPHVGQADRAPDRPFLLAPSERLLRFHQDFDSHTAGNPNRTVVPSLEVRGSLHQLLQTQLTSKGPLRRQLTARRSCPATQV